MNNFLSVGNKKKNFRHTPAYCIACFCLFFAAILMVGFLLRKYTNLIFQLFIFFSGWFAWTFLEYMSHRFLMHHNKSVKLIDFNHKHHHTHPHELKISTTGRIILLSSLVILISVSIKLDNYFSLAAGFLCGFPIYTFIHYSLHQEYAKKHLQKMVQYHIYHHCKHPDKCFGISVTWWDDLLQTNPTKKTVISPRVNDFYFGKENLKSISSVKKILLLLLLILSLDNDLQAQNKSLYYDVVRNGIVIGYLNVFEKIKNDKTIYHLESDVKTRFIFSYSSFITESVEFENGIMISSNYYKKENGKETARKLIAEGNNFKMISNGITDSEVFSQVHNNYLQLFFLKPEGFSQFFSNRYQQFLPIDKISENKYRIQLPGGEYTYFTYNKPGICTQVDAPRSLITIHFILKKIEKLKK